MSCQPIAKQRLLWVLPQAARAPQIAALALAPQGNSSKAAQFQAALERRLQAVQAVLWDEAAGTWLDFNLLTKQLNPAFYPSNLVPLWAECFVDEAVVGKVLRYLQVSHTPEHEDMACAPAEGDQPPLLLHVGMPLVWASTMYLPAK